MKRTQLGSSARRSRQKSVLHSGALHDGPVPDPSYVALTDLLLGQPQARQRLLAVALADLTIPFADLPHDGERRGGFASVVDVIRGRGDVQEIDAVRHRLFEGSWLTETDEPVGLAWYPYRARVAWIYAADAVTTSPRDGVLNTFLVVDDMLDQVDTDLGDTALASQLHVHVGVEEPDLDALLPTISAAVTRLETSLGRD
jgi:hypothetical protein